MTPKDTLALNALRYIEWSEVENRCPACGSTEDGGHIEDCRIGDAIAALTTPTPQASDRDGSGDAAVAVYRIAREMLADPETPIIEVRGALRHMLTIYDILKANSTPPSGKVTVTDHTCMFECDYTQLSPDHKCTICGKPGPKVSP